MILFAQRIKQLRTDKGLSQQNLADMLGIHQTSVLGWEASHHRASYELLEKLSQIFEVSVGYLLGLED